MKTKTPIGLAGILAGALALSGCDIRSQLPGVMPTEELYERAKWITVPYTKEIWTSYMGERKIAKSDDIWKDYMRIVGQRNGFVYSERNGVIYIVEYDKKTMDVPDLDGGGVKIKINSAERSVDGEDK